MKKLELKNVLWKEGRHYVAQCLNVDVSSFGKTKTEAVKNLKEALDLYFEDSNLSKVRKIDRPVIVEQKLQYA
ncbi:MAG: type II toxin-antitoxin system HicB family antitoxin [Patescibacteria group bacterium]|nr:type II toxin-antitoxin system HicB family antitoxin [Patescibacteria group bacterium]MDE1988628.1 type II toxin-antitoxin system HicB family antitoxin [Patescibacteria group bacterium]MDE2217916.1 type II toxin-antitoxin system HicB family antitoxin [Patescibacteria group bacterium]